MIQMEWAWSAFANKAANGSDQSRKSQMLRQDQQNHLPQNIKTQRQREEMSSRMDEMDEMDMLVLVVVVVVVVVLVVDVVCREQQ